MTKSPWLIYKDGCFQKNNHLNITNIDNWWLCGDVLREFFSLPHSNRNLELRLVLYHHETPNCYKIIGTNSNDISITIETTEGDISEQVYDCLFDFICDHTENWIGLEYRVIE